MKKFKKFNLIAEAAGHESYLRWHLKESYWTHLYLPVSSAHWPIKIIETLFRLRAARQDAEWELITSSSRR
jgi:hypothetical protein